MLAFQNKTTMTLESRESMLPTPQHLPHFAPSSAPPSIIRSHSDIRGTRVVLRIASSQTGSWFYLWTFQWSWLFCSHPLHSPSPRAKFWIVHLSFHDELSQGSQEQPHLFLFSIKVVSQDCQGRQLWSECFKMFLNFPFPSKPATIFSCWSLPHHTDGFPARVHVAVNPRNRHVTIGFHALAWHWR